MENKILVSVAMPTYGQEKFISEALLGVLSQQCNFDIEILVADDCSPDNTEEIVQNIIENHPNGSWIKYIRHKKNRGAIPNFAWTISQTTGKYIAICEGDDYWTDPLKLQKQVDFLERSPEYSIVFHKVKEVDLHGVSTGILVSPDNEETYDIYKLAAGNFIHTPSVVFKKNFREFPEWMDISPIGDYPLHMLNAQYGLIKYLPEEMAVYRVGSGIWSSQSKIYKYINTLITLKLLISYFSNLPDVQAVLTKQYNSWLDELQTVKVQNIICYDPEKISDHFTYKALVSMILKKIRKKIKAGYSK
ncbi:glycosyltransferase [uncultured Chryseobacterium sp.]|uniref:glycosyltransferase family 2 protein n=1 Tax=uncultured Chryseobacterium sp. TaxID=259322 RepID=UPI0025ED83B8|nr:glycosyltransferase [uncultured Chryseobacterium sp.]